jgi:arylsulfatase A-like enzyme
MTRSLVVAILLACAACSRTPEKPKEQRNIVFVLADDLNTRLLPYLPGLDRMLPARGLALQMTVPTPVCAPSRATILTGRYAHNTAVKGNGPLRGGIWAFEKTGAEKSTFATWLRDVGYHTGFFGKYLNEQDQADQAVPPGWERWVGYGKMTLSRVGYSVIENGKPVRVIDDQYDTDFFAARANEWLETVPEPFLAVWSPMAPHGPFVPPQRHRGRFDDVKFDWPPSFSANEQEVAQLTRTRLEMMLGLEDGLRAMLATLQKRGLLDRTYVFFTSDHGLFMGEHGFPAGKGESYDETTRVPLFVRGPGVPVGRSDALIASTDLAPTFAAIGGAAVPANVDGRSILPLLQGGTIAQPRQRMLLEWFDQDSTSPWLAVREANDKYVRTKDGTCLHFDMRSDPYEMSPKPCDADEAQRTAATVTALAKCAGASCSDVEHR